MTTLPKISGLAIVNRAIKIDNLNMNNPKIDPDQVNYLNSTVLSDAHFFVDKEKGIELHFLQSRASTNAEIQRLDSVASVRFNDINDLKSVEASIKQKIWDLEHQE